MMCLSLDTGSCIPKSSITHPISNMIPLHDKHDQYLFKTFSFFSNLVRVGSVQAKLMQS